MNSHNSQGLTFITTKQVLNKIGIGRIKLYLLMQTNNSPKPIRFSHNCMRWNLDEIDAWIEQQMMGRE